MLGVDSWGMTMTVEKISAVTFRVSNMKVSVQFYRDVLGMEVLYGGVDAPFSSLRAKDAECPIRTGMSCRLRGQSSSLRVDA